jgi:fructose-1,6-bisphosphatase I
MLAEPTTIDTRHVPNDLRKVMDALARVAADLSATIARGPFGQSLGHAVGETGHGDDQMALDVLADAAYADALPGTGIRFYSSEEHGTARIVDSDGAFALAIDPLDGSSNIDVNVSIGTIFSIFEAGPDPQASFLRPGRDQIGAGYVIFGPHTAMMATFGKGTLHFVLDPATRRFELVEAAVTLPARTREFAINTSNYARWTRPVRAYVDDCLAGENGPRQGTFNMRWIASLVAETHRILTRGGIFLYPGDARPAYHNGRLRMVYECAPIAFLIEQAGGLATDGGTPILDKIAGDLHARTPLVFGSMNEVRRVTAYHDNPEEEVSALFGTRGLFRV